MAENQTAAEDSGQQSTQHQTHPHHNLQQQQQQQQQQHSHNDNLQTLSSQNSEELSSALTSPTTPPNENNSASSPEEPQTIVIANHHHQQQSSQVQQPIQQQQDRSMIDRQVTTKIKTIRRNTIQTTTVTVRSTSTTSIKKPVLTKMNSLSCGTSNNEKNTTTEKHHLQQQAHHHHHHQHNNMTNHHHHSHQYQNNSSPSAGTNSNSTTVHRTTSESLRLNAIPPGSGANAAVVGGTDSLSNATSNSSIHSILTNNSSSSASVAPKSTSTNASHSKSITSKSSSASSKATSPNNNNSIASVTAGSSHASRSHHSHGHIQSHGHGHVAGGVRKPKTTSSFQITSVTVGQPKATVAASDNGEEESADDLDESHTDDNSRITDLENETPSMSEDTFSKEEIYYHQDDALTSTAPAIPTSSQYGLVVTTLGAQDISNVQVNVGENFINVVPGGSGIKKEDLKDSAQHRSERFKVVKIESTEPFRRGRWVCMDYLDHTSVSGKDDGSSGGAGNNNEKTEAGGMDNGEHASKTTQSMILGPGATGKESHVETTSAPTADGNWNFPDATAHMGAGGTSTAPATVAHGIQQFVETAEGTEQQPQIIKQDPQYRTPPHEVNTNATPQMPMPAQAPPPDVVPSDYATVAAQKLKKSLEELKKQEEAIVASEKAAAAAGGVYMSGQSQPVNFDAMQQQQQQQVPMQQPQQVALQQQQHASTLPGNINIQNGKISIAPDNKTIQQNKQQMMPEPQQQTQSLGYSVDTAQQSMPAASQQIQVPANFVTAGFQGTPQLTPPQQSPQMQEAGPAVTQQPQQPQQQMTSQPQLPQQHVLQAPPQQPQPTQLQQQTSQTDGVTNMQNTSTVSSMQQQQQTVAQNVQQQLPHQFQQLQQHQQPLAPGQTMPILTQMSSYDMQQQLQHQQSAPATMLDNSALLSKLQQQQQQQQQQQSSATNAMSGSTNVIMQSATGTVPSQYQQQQQPLQQQPKLPTDSAPLTNINVNSSNTTVNVNAISSATMTPITSSNAPSAAANAASVSNNNNNATTNIDNQSVLQSQQQQSQQLMQPQQQQQQQHQQQPSSSQLQNAETETERSVSSLTQAMSTNNQTNQGNNRKRAFSTPYITTFDQQMLLSSVPGSEQPQLLQMPSNVGGNNDQNIYFYNKSSSGRSSFCIDESMWPAGQAMRSTNNNPALMHQLESDPNIYTSLALGNDRYKLPVEFTTSQSPAGSIATKRESEDENYLDDLVNENEEDLEESVDQFSPLLYPAMQQRSQPIAISAGNSPVHMPKGNMSKKLTGGQRSPKRTPSPTAVQQHYHMALSASPTSGLFPYSPFYSSSPDIAQNKVAPQHISASVDHLCAANVQNLSLPAGQELQNQQQQPQQQPKQLPRQPPLSQQRHSQPSTSSQLTSPIQPKQRFSASSIESAPGAFYATSPTASPSNSASGTSAVAIDNKIEQAMDLVKSHLMIAVREEVEVLKEKISELMDKINQLEVENTILKANMSQETLQQLQMQTQLQIAGSTPTNGSNMITGAPTTAAIASAPTAAAPTSAAASAVPNAAVNANSNSSTAAATPQSNVGSGTATPTTQQPTAAEQNVETTQITNVANADDSQVSAQTTNGPMS